MEDSLNQKLIESGEAQRLKELVRRRLEESGWHDAIRKNLADAIRRRGVENVTVDDLVEEVTPKARQSVPESVKRELMNQLEAFIYKETNISLKDG